LIFFRDGTGRATHRAAMANAHFEMIGGSLRLELVDEGATGVKLHGTAVLGGELPPGVRHLVLTCVELADMDVAEFVRGLPRGLERLTMAFVRATGGGSRAVDPADFPPALRELCVIDSDVVLPPRCALPRGLTDLTLTTAHGVERMTMPPGLRNACIVGGRMPAFAAPLDVARFHDVTFSDARDVLVARVIELRRCKGVPRIPVGCERLAIVDMPRVVVAARDLPASTTVEFVGSSGATAAFKRAREEAVAEAAAEATVEAAVQATVQATAQAAVQATAQAAVQATAQAADDGRQPKPRNRRRL
jgi:hypothetical protein